jgi:septum site-determining protein MinC
MAQAQQARGKTAAKQAEVFELKSASLSLLALVLKSADLGLLNAELRQRVGDTPEVFSHEPLLIDLSQLQRPGARSDAPPAALVAEGEQAQLNLDGGGSDAAPAEVLPAAADIDLQALVALLRGYRMQPVAVTGANAAELAAAHALGLADAPDAEIAPSAPRGEPIVQRVIQEVVREVEVIREVQVPADAPKTLIIDKPLRSGQQVYAKGADLVVLALVNHGAEVIADGSIHVYAPLRGKAIAGARGDSSARIFAASLEAELIAIAGIYRTTENPLPEAVLGKAAQVRLDGEKLVMEALKS